MNQQTSDQGGNELRAIIGGIFDHVLRKEKEAALNEISMERPTEKSYAGDIESENVVAM